MRVGRIRSLLFTPANVSKMVAKGRQSRAHVQLLDLEDSVPRGEKEGAREVIREMLGRGEETEEEEGRPLLCTRVNHTGELLEEDLRAAVGPRAWGVTLPKAESAAQIHSVCTLMGQFEQNMHLPVGRIVLLPWIETATGVEEARNIAAASQRVIGLLFGADDFRADLGVQRTAEASRDPLLLHARLRTVIAARAAGKMAWDTPFHRVSGPGWQEDLVAAVTESRACGFHGMACIHPGHLDAVNKGFGPSVEDLRAASELVRQFVDSVHAGRASLQIDGRMVDVPVFRAALKVLQSGDDVDPRILREAEQLALKLRE